MTDRFEFLNQIQELIQANGWQGKLVLEVLPGNDPSESWVRVKLSPDHLTAPDSIVNEYKEGLHPLEQVQQECLRALRTGRPGA